MDGCQESEPDRPGTIPAKSCSRRRRGCSRNRESAAPASRRSRPEAGFTRGAFYSNFKSKDELIIAMLEEHVEQSIRRNLDLLARHKNIADFIDALKTMDRSQQDPLGRSPLLHMEMILFVARAEKRRPELAKRLRARRKLIADIVETTSKNSGKNRVLNPTWTGAILLALEDGFRLHRLIDPETTPPDSFLRAIGDLQRAIGISSA